MNEQIVEITTESIGCATERAATSLKMLDSLLNADLISDSHIEVQTVIYNVLSELTKIDVAMSSLNKNLGRSKQTTQKFHRILTNPLFYKV